MRHWQNQINQEIKELEESLPGLPSYLQKQTVNIDVKKEFKPGEHDPPRSIKEIDDSKNNLQTEIGGLHQKISNERKQWEGKL